MRRHEAFVSLPRLPDLARHVVGIEGEALRGRGAVAVRLAADGGNVPQWTVTR